MTFATILHWEKGQAEPRIKDIPTILQSLGYDPFPEAVTLGERMLAYRRKQGLDFEAVAASCGLIGETWMYWEHGMNKKWWPQTKRTIEAMLAEHDAKAES